MEKDPENARHEDDIEQLSILLRSLMLEATPEDHFEERFLYDFRERIARDTVCRPAHSLLWEHMLMMLDSWGGRRLAMGVSTFSLGVLCTLLYAWHQSPAPAELSSSSFCALEQSASSLRPGASRGVVCTSVRRSRSSRAHSSFLASAYEDDTTSSAHDDWGSSFASDSADDSLYDARPSPLFSNY